jgi:hypothetical protein
MSFGLGDQKTVCSRAKMVSFNVQNLAAAHGSFYRNAYGWFDIPSFRLRRG